MRCRTNIGLRLDDIVNTFKPFKGDGHTNVEKWIKEFEDQCRIFNVPESHRIIFAKRVIKGAARMYINHESKATFFFHLSNFI